jgi:hypothetical protein
MAVMILVLGAAAGILAGLFGIGGGIIMVMGMVTVLRMPFLTATGTSLAAMLLPVGVLGAWEYWRNGNVDPRAAALLAGGLFIGSWLGARLANDLPPGVVQRAFAAFLVLMAARLWFTAS